MIAYGVWKCFCLLFSQVLEFCQYDCLTFNQMSKQKKFYVEIFFRTFSTIKLIMSLKNSKYPKLNKDLLRYVKYKKNDVSLINTTIQ